MFTVEETYMPLKPCLESTSSNNVCGWCWCHKKYITPNQMKKHNCLGKQCNALKKLDHPIWQMRARRNELRKTRKMQRSSILNRNTAIHAEG